MRTLLLSLLFMSSLFGKQDISTQIHTTSKKIKSYDQKYSSLHKKMAKIATAIQSSEKSIKRQEKEITNLSAKLKASQEDYKANQKKLQALEKKQQLLQGTQDQIEKELISAIARNISINTLEKDRYTTTTENIITEEILQVLNQQTQEAITRLDKEHRSNAKNISVYQIQTDALKKSIAKIDKQKASLLAITNKNRKALQKMHNDKKNYKKSMKRLLAQKRALSSTLARLNIIQSEETRKANERAKKRKHKKNATAKVTKKGSSYQSVRYKRYRGRKTIAPLSKYRVVKKFGPYTDPIYHIKIFNESVSLQPKHNNAKVYTIFNGKVILVKKTQLLDNVVIIKHSNGIHTIYAHLDKVAPNIKKGKKIKKGAVIGRVDHELTFEVTQDSYHLNPMTLIKK